MPRDARSNATLEWEAAALARVEKALRRLERYPKTGRTIPEFPELPYRELVFPPYRFVFRVQDNEVWIVAVWHSAQSPESFTESVGPAKRFLSNRPVLPISVRNACS